MYGEHFAEVQQTIRLREVPKEIAAGLRVKVGSNVAEICRLYRLTTSTVAMIALNLHPADSFSYSMILRRQTP
jgi:GntR family transcriptional regulator